MNQSAGTKTILLMTFFLFFYSTHNFWLPLSAQAYADGKKPGYDAVFVLDTSYSMTDSDPEGIAAEVINMFMDMSEASQTRVGFAAYSHRIVALRPLTSVSVSSHKQQIQQEIRQLRPSGYTDIGLGLKQGAKLLSDGTQEDRQPFLILLSDGETDLGPSSAGRTKTDSEDDVAEVIQLAQEEGFPIHTIGLNHDGTVNREQLEHIAAETGGSSYITSSADDLPEIFNRIFANQIRSKLMPSAAITATGELQEAVVNIPDSTMEEANLILLSEHKLKEAQIYYDSQNIRRYESNKYTILKIGQPDAGEVKLKLKGRPGDLIKISLLGSYAIDLQSTLTPGAASAEGGSSSDSNGNSTSEVLKGQKNLFEARLIGQEGEPVKDEALYKPLTAELVINPEEPDRTERIGMTYTDGVFRAEYSFPETGIYAWQILLDGPGFYRIGSIHSVQATNIAPVASGDWNLSAVREDGDITLNLNEYFQDMNGDPLVYTLSDQQESFPLAATQITEDGQLILHAPKTGKGELIVTATDPSGESASSALLVTISSKYTVLKWTAAGGACALAAAALLYLLLRPKPQFTGRLEGLFLATASGEDIPVKSWPLTSFGGGTVTLAELFRTLQVQESLPEAARIVFSAGKQGKLYVKHSTRCAVQIGKMPVPAGKKAALDFNEKLYVTFEDGITEIELRYKAIKPNTNIYTDHLTVKISS